MKKIELLAPAGNFEKLKIAYEYGADAVYAGAKKFSLRNLTENLSYEEFLKAKELKEKLNKKLYLTLNIYPYNEDIQEIEEFITKFKEIPDAFIVSDPGVIYLFKKIAPEVKLHLSTQANTTNFLSVKFWKDIGIKRINLARELSLEDIKEIRRKNKDIELEVFIHGAMCMAISGRCLLSNFLTGRASNQGECTHPCRWKYYFIEETRKNEIFEIEEDDRGIYLFNSKDLCGIYFIPDLIKIGIDSLKIEGRMKSAYYVANVVRIYRKAIDEYYNNPEKFKIKDEWLEELKLVSHRDYTKGFFLKRNFIDMQKIDSSKYIRKADFLGLVLEVNKDKIFIEVRNKIKKDDEVEIITKDLKNIKLKFDEFYNLDGEKIEIANPNSIIYIKNRNFPIHENSILRRKHLP